MQVLDSKLDNSPSNNDIQEFAEKRIQNLICFKELRHYNDTGEFLFEHPILRLNKDFEELTALWKSDKPDFIRKRANCENNIRRYSARMNKANVSTDDMNSAHALKELHQTKLIIFNKIINNE